MKAVILLLSLCVMPVSLGEKAEKIDPKAIALRAFNDGVFQMKRKRYEAARDKFAEALKKQPKLAEAYNNYAYCTRMVSEDNYEEALKYYGAALKLKPTLAIAYQYRGCLHILMGNRDLAISDYRKLAKLDPELAKTLEEFIKNDGKDPVNKSYYEEY